MSGRMWHEHLRVWCVVQRCQKTMLPEPGKQLRPTPGQFCPCPDILSSSLSLSPAFLAASSMQYCAIGLADTLRTKPPHRPSMWSTAYGPVQGLFHALHGISLSAPIPSSPEGHWDCHLFLCTLDGPFENVAKYLAKQRVKPNAHPTSLSGQEYLMSCMAQGYMKMLRSSESRSVSL